MNQYEEIIKSKITENYEQVLIIDVIDDKIYKYINSNNNFVLEKEISYVDYFSNCKNFIFEDDIGEYIDSLSINKLENNGNRLVLNYRMIDSKVGTYMNYVNTISLFDDNGKKIIVVLVAKSTGGAAKQLDTTNPVSKSAYENKFNKLIDSISISMLKIHNVINMDNNLRTKDEYINSVLAELTREYPELNKSLNENAGEVYNSGKTTILIVDDDKMTCNLISKVFDKKYNILVAHNGKEAIETITTAKNSNTHISCIFLDLIMPEMDGFAVLEYLNDNNFLMKLPVVIISGNYDKETRNKAYSYQIADMLEKPFNAQVIRHRIENLITLYRSSSILNELLLEQQQDVTNIIQSLIKAYEVDNNKDMIMLKKYVKILTTQVATQYPEYNISSNVIDKITDSAAYYSIGKYTLPRSIVLKTGDYTPEEAEVLKQENINGAAIAKTVLGNDNSKVDPQFCYDITRYYHERYDGTGYPEGINGNIIPLSAAIVSLVVEYMHLIKEFNSIGYEKIASLITMESGHKFNPKVVEAFKNVKDQFEVISKVGE